MLVSADKPVLPGTAVSERRRQPAAGSRGLPAAPRLLRPPAWRPRQLEPPRVGIRWQLLATGPPCQHPESGSLQGGAERGSERTCTPGRKLGVAGFTCSCLHSIHQRLCTPPLPPVAPEEPHPPHSMRSAQNAWTPKPTSVQYMYPLCQYSALQLRQPYLPQRAQHGLRPPGASPAWQLLPPGGSRRRLEGPAAPAASPQTCGPGRQPGRGIWDKQSTATATATARLIKHVKSTA